jgi:hypothetical protein
MERGHRVGLPLGIGQKVAENLPFGVDDGLTGSYSESEDPLRGSRDLLSPLACVVGKPDMCFFAIPVLRFRRSIKGDVKRNTSATTGGSGEIRLAIQPLCWSEFPWVSLFRRFISLA